MERRWKRVEKILTQAGIPRWGTAPLEFCGPLLPCRGAQLIEQRHQTVISCLFPYYVGEMPYRNLSYYACVPDYHRVAGEILRRAAGALKEAFPSRDFLPFVDSSPIREVRAAALAGLGCIGKQGLLLAPDYGSYVFLGELVTDLPVEGPVSPIQSCIGCGECVKRCPGGALTREGLDKERCLSQITQKRGELTGEEQALIQKSGILWGCDRCQEVCPMNREVKNTPIPDFYREKVAHIDPSITKSGIRGRAFGFRGVRVLRRNARILEGSLADTMEKGEG